MTETLPEAITFVDPDEARRQAEANGLFILRPFPLNCEAPLTGQRGLITPNEKFYIRSNFKLPKIDAGRWRLAVGGLVEQPLSLSLADLQAMPAHSVIVTLECAGNGRSKLDPPAEGEQWQFAAVSTAEWTGVPLRDVLARAGVQPGAREVRYRGADSGVPRGRTETVFFERSLNLDWANNPDVLLAYAMNGEPLPLEHGFPLRMLVPSWYGMASVKWLTELELIGEPFQGHYQINSYVMERQRDGQLVKEPVTQELVRALITEPAIDSTVPAGQVIVRGFAWSGRAPISKVDLSVDGGAWQATRLLGSPIPYTWQRWELPIEATTPGRLILRARATDALGRTQPDTPDWNRLGYCNNAVLEVPVEVR
jgi:DMSO/TMAO reductase YedYZ molybdopterin-dependent catalytic subunit